MIRINRIYHPLGTVPHESPPPGLADRLHRISLLTRLRAALGLPDPMADKRLVRRVLASAECPRCARTWDECDCPLEVCR